jgi:hypothetical protein
LLGVVGFKVAVKAPSATIIWLGSLEFVPDVQADDGIKGKPLDKRLGDGFPKFSDDLDIVDEVGFFGIGDKARFKQDGRTGIEPQKTSPRARCGFDAP